MWVVTSKQHISAFRASILKNLVSFGKIFQFPAIQVLLEVASSNRLEVMSQWSNNPHFTKEKKNGVQGSEGYDPRLPRKPLPFCTLSKTGGHLSSGRAYQILMIKKCKKESLISYQINFYVKC